MRVITASVSFEIWRRWHQLHQRQNMRFAVIASIRPTINPHPLLETHIKQGADLALPFAGQNLRLAIRIEARCQCWAMCVNELERWRNNKTMQRQSWRLVGLRGNGDPYLLRS